MISTPFSACLHWLGDCALQIDVRGLENLLGKQEGGVTPGVLAAGVSALGLQGVCDVVPSYDMVTIHVQPEHASSIRTEVESWLPRAVFNADAPYGCLDIPVCYAEPFALDLKEVARLHGLSCEEVIALHTAPVYEVAMLGFSPGFPYLEGLDARLVTPRLATPRLSVPAGAVGIGGSQTGIYPTSSPGGWRLIGRTPLSLFNPLLHPPCLLSPGMRVRFVPITLEQYHDIVQAMASAKAMRVGGELALFP